MEKIEDLLREALQGSRRAFSRLLTYIENDHPATIDIMRFITPFKKGAPVIGVTGPPGSGKSSLIGRLIESYRKKGIKVGVIAVDPSSPKTGGAILADRLRIEGEDNSVFIRSMATRSHVGGLTKNIGKILDLYDAFGFERILVETCGIGQDEVEIMEVAHIVLLLLTGEQDEIQLMKAGIMEIADLYVINKIDEIPPLRLREYLRFLLDQEKEKKEIVEISAKYNTNIEFLVNLIESKRPLFKKKKPMDPEVILKEVLLDWFRKRMGHTYENLLKAIREGNLNIYEEIEGLLK